MSFKRQASTGILHVCGGDPMQAYNQHIAQMVFSTYVEVILASREYLVDVAGILHVCGGDPVS